MRVFIINILPVTTNSCFTWCPVGIPWSDGAEMETPILGWQSEVDLKENSCFQNISTHLTDKCL